MSYSVNVFVNTDRTITSITSCIAEEFLLGNFKNVRKEDNHFEISIENIGMIYVYHNNPEWDGDIGKTMNSFNIDIGVCSADTTKTIEDGNTILGYELFEFLKGRKVGSMILVADLQEILEHWKQT